jgi:hypothetical protein
MKWMVPGGSTGEVLMMFNGARLICIAVICIVITVSGGMAAEHKVAPSGATFTSIQDAIDAASPNDTILVAEGVYSHILSREAPDGYIGAAYVFQVVYIDKQLGIFGGYNSDFSQRDPEVYHTVIEGLNQARCIFFDSGADAVIDGFRVQNGNAAGLGGTLTGDAGGAVFVQDASPIIINSGIRHSEADFGAGIFFSYAGYPNLFHSTIESNHAYGSGGGVYMHASGGEISGCLFHDNHADGFGGALYVTYNAPLIHQNTFEVNATSGEGGAIFMYYSGAELVSNDINGNYAMMGAALSSFWSTGLIDKNRIIANNAYTVGGGCLIMYSEHLLTNNFICGNTITATSGGAAAIFADNSSLTMRHNTVDSNTGGNGSGIQLSDNTDAIIQNQITSNHVCGVLVEHSASVSFDHTLWHDNLWDWDGMGSITHGTVAFFGDPLYVDPVSHDYHIMYGSPAINMGMNAGVYDDIDGHVRPWNGGFDIGVDEHRYVPRRGVWLNMPLMIRPFETFFIHGYLENDTQEPITDVMVFFLLDIMGDYWFWPGWSHFNAATSDGVDFKTMNVQPGSYKVWVLNPFTWPDTGNMEMSDLRFWGVMVDTASMTIIGDHAVETWGFGPL